MGWDARNRIADLRGAPVNGRAPEIAGMTAGGIALPKMQEIEADADLSFKVADAFASTVLLGKPLVLAHDQHGKPLSSVLVPHFGALLEKMRAEWPAPTPRQAERIGMVEAAFAFQRYVHEHGQACHAADVPTSSDDVLPEPPPWTPRVVGDEPAP